MRPLVPLLLSMTSLVSCQVVTPRREPGLVYNGGSPAAKVRVDFYIDPLCPETATAWPHVLAMADHYGPDNIRLAVQPFPLPYHQNSFYIAKAAYVIHALSNGTRSIEWLDRILLHEMYSLTDTAFFNKTDVDLLDTLSTIVTSMDIDGERFVQLTDRRNSNDYETYTRVAWKVAATRGVAGTPTFFVNGVNQPQVRAGWSVDDWRSLIDPLVTSHEFDGLGQTGRNEN